MPVGACGFKLKFFNHVVQVPSIQKHQRVQRNFLSANRAKSIDGEMIEERFYFDGTHVLRIAFLVKENESLDPVNIRLFGSIG
jgi:hypothetical protein